MVIASISQKGWRWRGSDRNAIVFAPLPRNLQSHVINEGVCDSDFGWSEKCTGFFLCVFVDGYVFLS